MKKIGNRATAQASGRFVVRMPARTHAVLREEARKRRLSLNALVLERIGAHGPALDGRASGVDIAPILDAYGNRLAGVVLFGSAARGEQTEASDTDLLIVLKPGNAVTRGVYREWDRGVAGKLPHNVSPHVVEAPGDIEALGSLWLEIALEGRVLYDRDGSVGKALVRLRERIADGRAIRRWSHGHPYWVRKDSTGREERTR